MRKALSSGSLVTHLPALGSFWQKLAPGMRTLREVCAGSRKKLLAIALVACCLGILDLSGPGTNVLLLSLLRRDLFDLDCLRAFEQLRYRALFARVLLPRL